MLLTSKSAHNVGVGYDPRVRLGPRILPRPRVAATANTFNGMYSRPNLNNGGAVPAQGALCTCPDIWIGGVQPVANFQTALATTGSYATQSGNTVTRGKPNYIYVRAVNGMSTPQSTQVQLYALPCGVIQWPSQWQNYAIPTDIEHDPTQPPVYASSINNLAIGAIGVAQDTFVWANPTPPPPGSDHYCLISWLNNPQSPFPDVFTQLDMANLVLNNLGFGWRNVSMVDGRQATVQMQTQLDIPSNISGGSTQYFIVVTPTGFPSGWAVEMSCSQTDAKGQPIAIPYQQLPTQVGAFIGVYCWLDPGFSATLTFSLYQNSAGAPAPGAILGVQVQYVSAPHELERALGLGVVDHVMSQALTKAFAHLSHIGPVKAVPLGADNMRTS